MRRGLTLRTTVLALSVALAVPACRSARDNNLPRAITNVPGMVEPARDVMADPAPPAQKVVPKPDVAETHQAEVLKTTPQPVKKEPLKAVPKIKMLGPGPEPDLRVKTEPLPYKGSR